MWWFGLILMDETEPVGPRKASQSLGVKMMKIKIPGSANLMGAATILCFLILCESASAQAPCERTIKASVVALDQAYYNNRLGAFQAGGMIFALRRDVVSTGVRRANSSLAKSCCDLISVPAQWCLGRTPAIASRSHFRIF